MRPRPPSADQQRQCRLSLGDGVPPGQHRHPLLPEPAAHLGPARRTLHRRARAGSEPPPEPAATRWVSVARVNTTSAKPRSELVLPCSQTCVNIVRLAVSRFFFSHSLNATRDKRSLGGFALHFRFMRPPGNHPSYFVTNAHCCVGRRALIGLSAIYRIVRSISS